MSTHLPETRSVPRGGSGPPRKGERKSGDGAVREATERLLAAAELKRPEAALDNLEPPAAGEQRAVRERLELLDIFGEGILEESRAEAEPAKRPRRVAEAGGMRPASRHLR